MNGSDPHPPSMTLFKVDSPAPTAFPYNATSYANPSVALSLATLTIAAFFANAALAGYIFVHRLYRNFISSHFIAHLCLTNMFALGVLVPIFIANLWIGTNFWADSSVICRLQV